MLPDNLGDARKAVADRLSSAGISTYNLDALILVEKVTRLDRSYISAHSEEKLNEEARKELATLMEKRLTHAPIAHLTGAKEFMALDFKVTPDVLIPRPESEAICEIAIRLAPKSSKLLDVGTGCGALAIATGSNRPDLIITATDISEKILSIASLNAHANKVSLNLIKSDLLEKVDGKFATILANLPYLPTNPDLNEEAKHEPDVALIGGDDGLDIYRRFLPQAEQHLEPGGLLVVESDPWQQPDLEALAKAHGLKLIEQTYFVSAFRFGS